MSDLDIWSAPEQTLRRVGRFEQWAGEYVKAIREHWRNSGEDVDSERGQKAFAFICRQVMVPERREWMAPARAVAVIVEASEDECADPGRQLEYRDAMRTAAALSEREWREVCAQVMGVTPSTIKAYRQDRPDKGRTAVYWHHSADGDLLYVGITADLERRWRQHCKDSPWADDSVRVTHLWVETRAEAKRVEAEAIYRERPVHNVVHNDAAEDEARMLA